MRLFRRSVGFTRVALDAGQHTVFPGRCSSLGSWQNVVNRQLFAHRLFATVLTREPVSLEDVPATECHGIRRKSIVGRQYNDLRNTQPLGLRANCRFVIMRNQTSPVGP